MIADRSARVLLQSPGQKDRMFQGTTRAATRQLYDALSCNGHETKTYQVYDEEPDKSGHPKGWTTPP
jgi:hypothetical protein